MSKTPEITATATGASNSYTPPPGMFACSITSDSWATNVTPLEWYNGVKWLQIDEMNTPGTPLSVTEDRSFLLPGSVPYRLNPSAYSSPIYMTFDRL